MVVINGRAMRSVYPNPKPESVLLGEVDLKRRVLDLKN